MLQVCVNRIAIFVKHSLTKASSAQYDIEMKNPLNRNPNPLPLFMHANLLKHRERVPRSTSSDPFTVVKRFSNDLADARALDNVRMWVYGSEGMCIDLELSLEADGESIITEPFPDAYDGRFRGFTTIYRRYGGKDGGW